MLFMGDEMNLRADGQEILVCTSHCYQCTSETWLVKVQEDCVCLDAALVWREDAKDD